MVVGLKTNKESVKKVVKVKSIKGFLREEAPEHSEGEGECAN